MGTTWRGFWTGTEHVPYTDIEIGQGVFLSLVETHAATKQSHNEGIYVRFHDGPRSFRSGNFFDFLNYKVASYIDTNAKMASLTKKTLS